MTSRIFCIRLLLAKLLSPQETVALVKGCFFALLTHELS